MLHACHPASVQYQPVTPWTEGAITIVDSATIRSFVQAPTPQWADELYGQIAAATGVQPPPRLVWVRDAHGYGGVHAGTIIVIGAADLSRIATGVWQSRFTPIPDVWRPFYAQTTTTSDLVLAVTKVLMAHELGHAFRARNRVSEMGIPEERGADVITGWVAEQLGWSGWLDEMVMDHIGCRGGATVCGHPSPEGRVLAYREGRTLHRAQTHRARQVAANSRYGWPLWHAPQFT
jgi:hypothetical protein